MMKREAIMKTRIMLMSIIFMLLAIPAEARTVYAAVLSRDILEGISGAGDARLDTLVKTNNYFDPKNQGIPPGIPSLFYKGDFVLPADKTLIIMGGRTSIKTELERYQNQKVDSYSESLVADYCFLRKGVTEGLNVTYVEIYGTKFYPTPPTPKSRPVCDAPLPNLQKDRIPPYARVGLFGLARKVNGIGR
jgi:hypothetical protein